VSGLLVVAWLFPLAASALAASARFWWLPAVASLPALAAAILVPDGLRLEIPWLLLGSVLGLDETGRIFLAFTSVLWLAAGLYASGSMRADPQGGRFRVFFLLAMTGNLWLIVGRDLVSFYLGFSLMGLASYGLVIHDLTRFSLRAGKVYLVMTLAGELALFAALLLIASHAGVLAPDPADLVGLGDLPVALLLFGLAIKAGLVPLHVWLPLAHPAAPVPASAVLSGAMIKVALIGWLRFLPVGEAALTEWGLLLVFTGLATLFFAIPVGLVQSNPKVILAYSSVSKMGLMAVMLGLMLLEPALAPAGVVALSLYAAHHGLVKGGLFLSVGLRRHWGPPALVLAGTTLLALSLAAVPLSGGAVAKYGIKPLWLDTDWAWLSLAVAVSTTGTALLMIRFLWVIWRIEPLPSPGHAPGGLAWGGLVVLSLLFSLLLGTAAAWATNASPTLVALALVVPFAFVAWRRSDLLRPAVDRVPPGDLIGLVRPVLVILGYLLRTLTRWSTRLTRAGSRGLAAVIEAVGPPPADPERELRRWPSAGSAWLAITALLLVLSLFGPPLQLPVSAQTPAAAEAPSEPPQADRDVRPTGRSDPAEASSLAPPPEGKTPGSAPPVVGPAMPAEPEPVGATHQGPRSGTAAGSEPLSDAPPTTPRPASLPGEEAAPRRPPVVQTPLERDTPEAAATQPPSAPDEAVPPAASAGEAPTCDPDEPFVFGHPAVAESLQLQQCASGPGQPRPLEAPPLTTALVDLVQRYLEDLGYDPGPVDGLIGPRTRDAIRRFQRGLGAAPTGAIDFRLLEAIRAAAGPPGTDR
jgi:formate hydrogenlyase subunit 3/multisubunit Na+/H+ antiporter MnhD subunit